MMLAAHQPDLLPSTGFFHKMAKADLFDLAIHDQLNERGYTRRVKMRDRWSTLPLVAHPHGTRINEATLAIPAGPQLWRDIEGRYQGSRFWFERAEMVNEWVLAAADSRSLWMFNLSLILAVRDYLGIKTPVGIAGRVPPGGVAGIAELCDDWYPADTYLSGPGARDYLYEDAWHARTSTGLVWSRHLPWTDDGILTTIFDKDHPMEWVLAEGEADADREGADSGPVGAGAAADRGAVVVPLRSGPIPGTEYVDDMSRTWRVVDNGNVRCGTTELDVATAISMYGPLRVAHRPETPSDGRSWCPRCQRWKHLVIHSCPGVPQRGPIDLGDDPDGDLEGADYPPFP
jgi:hypothetical protein